MLTRRFFVSAAGAALWVPTPGRAKTTKPHFTLGVASGSPLDTSVVIWTRLAADPLNGGGMVDGLAFVRYRVCRDDAMRDTIYDGVAVTSSDKAHAVHVTVNGLEPGREYWYQFYYGDEESPIGRTRTTSRNMDSFRLALASCQSYQSGYYAAFGDMAEWAPDCVIHVGDYIYEGGSQPVGPVEREVGGRTRRYDVVRSIKGDETVTLWDYRNRYAQYKSDPQLQKAHAASPWIVAMDDHEIDNNWAGDVPQDPKKQSRVEFLMRKRAAFQAYYEHMPLRMAPTMAGLQMYSAHRFGPAHVSLLDTRSYRSDQVCGQGFPGDFPCEALDDPRLTMTGDVQEAWLMEQLGTSDATYNVIASQTWFAPYTYVDDPNASKRNMDQWDGYPVQRQRILDAMAGVDNPVVLSGDWHSAAAFALHQDPFDVNSTKVGHNFCGTSISSHCPWSSRLDEARDANPHAVYVNGDERGYLRCTADASGFTATYRTVRNPSDAKSRVSTDAEFRTSDI